MAEVGHLLSARHIKLLSVTPANPKFSASVSRSFTIRASSKRNSLSLGNKKNSRSSSPRSVIRLSTADGKWHGNWSCDYILSLQDLRLDDLIEDENTHDAQISVNLCVHKHASFGFSVDGRILTSFNRKCSNCSSTYCRKVIYVKPGNEAELDSLIQDTIRLATSIKDTCSELCEKSYPTVQYIGGKSTASVDKRWSRLLELKNMQ
ncbi:large ribosomal RNA subunit accumulation protein YCED homolog 2, chloroplastic isoform X2 [Malus sylvestris]|uniref:large ribosomal RNA subunit accumulation protein YCED homolog 2, chloroplastic isoform X2 n=1 Tax=Malus sylvestris TaxID=3752 RepID=UPI0010AB3C21|nr:large ribosomal RNA subunit accumulation protein YCED homolog 2, chloroplastic [Malus domestica]XP_050131967.1 large ribosomal RNA subunit accumulation protein YCED homolog 2, chloroplastic isoform X2 [Malus sylvestris]